MLEKIEQIIGEVHPEKIFSNQLRFYHNEIYIKGSKLDLSQFKKIHILGVGKAASAQVRALQEMMRENDLDSRIGKVMAVTKMNHSLGVDDIEEIESTHPVCSEYSYKAAKKIIDMVSSFDPDDLLIFCLSGGASALIALPVDYFSLSEKISIGELLLNSGANIRDMNLVRKEISAIKNGGLAYYCNARTIVNLTISDVPVTDFSVIGSSPTYYSRIDVDEVKSIAMKYLDVDHKLRDKVINYVDSDSRHEMKIVKERGLANKDIRNFIVADFNYLMERAISILAGMANKKIIPLDKCFDCVIDEAVDVHLDEIRQNLDEGFILISGGEATVEVSGSGIGGRNMHFVACMGLALFEKNILNLDESTLRKLTIYSVGTDGTDGPTEFAGGWLDYEKYLTAKESGVDLAFYVNDCNSLKYLKKTKTLIKTGPTGTNIMDLRVITFEGA